MRLGPHYLHFMTECVGLILTKGLLMPVGPADSNALIFIALYMMNDAAAHDEMLRGLEDRGDLICELWLRYYRHVVDYNNHGAESSKIEVNALLEKFQNENRGKNPG